MVVEVEDGAFADVDEEADVLAAPGVGENEWLALWHKYLGGKGELTSADVGCSRLACCAYSRLPASRRFPRKRDKCWGR